MTGMPACGGSAHDEEDSSKLVRFIRHLPQITSQEKNEKCRARIRRVPTRVLLIALAILPAIALAHGGLEHVRGTVAKVSDQSVTVTTTAGKTVEVLLDAQTTYARADQPIQKSDLKVGDRVVIHAAGEGNHPDRAHHRSGRVASKKP